MANIKKVADRFETTLSSSIDDSQTTIGLASVTGLDTGGGVVTIDRKDANGVATPTLLEEIEYTAISSLNLTGCARGVSGTAQSHNSGAKVEGVFSSTLWNDFVDAFEAEHTDPGRHSFTDKAPIMNVKFMAKVDGNNSFVAGVEEIVNYGTEVYDIGGDYNNATYKFTAPVTGYYYIAASMRFDTNITSKYIKLRLYQNTTNIDEANNVIADAANEMSLFVGGKIFSLTAADTVEVRAIAEGNDSVNKDAIGNIFNIHLISQDS